jgi:3-oxoacyl-[acyl-carrier-protein] synthase II
MSAAHALIVGVGTALHGLSRATDLLGIEKSGPGIPFDSTTALVGRDLRNKDRGSRLAIRAVEAALSDAGPLDRDTVGRALDPDTTAVVVSSNLGNLGSVCELTDTIAAETALGLDPLRLPETACSVIAASVAMRFGLRGPNLTVCNGVTSGLDALFWAQTLLAAGRARAVVVVGVEPTNEAVRRMLGNDSVDGAAALLLQPVEGTTDSSVHRNRALVAGYARASDMGTAIAAVGLGDRREVELWLTEASGQTAVEVAEVGLSPAGALKVVSVEGLLGPCSGALGVIQCALGAAYLEDGGDGPVLATAGATAGPASAVLLTAAT